MRGKIDFYTLPSTRYAGITENDACTWVENVDCIKKHDKLYVPYAIYDERDQDGITVDEFYQNSRKNDKGMHDAVEYIMRTLWELGRSDASYDLLKSQESNGFLAFRQDVVEDIIVDRCVQGSPKKLLSDLLAVRRVFALKSESYEEYVQWFQDIFPSLLFHENACDTIEKLGDYKNVISELHRHLCALNDYGRSTYLECEMDEAAALSALKAKCNVTCSGKGSKEIKDYKLEYNGIKITCNPHTKLNNSHSDQRIYFCWGRDEVADHKIIIARIGRHWE